MGDEAKEISPEEMRKAWLKRLGNEYLRVEQFVPKSWFTEDEYPDWVRQVEREFAKAVLPAARLHASVELTPHRVGAIIGHQCSNAVWLMSVLKEEWEKALALKGSKPCEPEPKAESNSQGGELEQWYDGLRRLAKLSLCSSVDQHYDDMSEFLTGFAAGFAGKPKSTRVGEIGSSAFQIYLVLRLRWRQVATLNSVAELHQFFVKLLGSNRAGDLKRMEKICQRIGLHFRKPGRPKKEIIQTPTPNAVGIKE